ncbi:hypothetical protein AB0F17_58665 [Nonomuraea sp. NPDC026600]|uniref:hypothetical protein n=1 Tax=Nonomuraea sp. NPDC026600 TaxID=3155363 RepID=UPI0033C1B44B
MITPTAKAPALTGCGSLLATLAAGTYALAQLLTDNLGVGGWALATAWFAMRLYWTQRDLAELRSTTRSSP